MVDNENNSRILRKAFGIEYRRSWLQHQSPAEDLMYTPQLGDDVVFLPRVYALAHSKFLPLNPLTNPLHNMGSKGCEAIDQSFDVKCRIIEVKYVFPDVNRFGKSRVVMAKLTLAVLAIPNDDDSASRKRKRDSDQSRDSADMLASVNPKFGKFMGVNSNVTKLRSDEVPSKRHCLTVFCNAQCVHEFLVLDTKYEQGIRAGWNVGDRVESTVIDLDDDQEPLFSTRMTGTVRKVVADMPVVLDGVPVIFTSARGCFGISWDRHKLQDVQEHTEHAPNFSPWDIGYIDKQQNQRKAVIEESCSATHRAKARRLSQTGKEQLLSALDRIMAQESFKYFVHLSTRSHNKEEAHSPLPLLHMPDYLYIIANPVDLNLIRARLANDYYRQRESFESDLETLCLNTKLNERPLSRQFTAVEVLRNTVKQVLETTWPRQAPASGSRVKEVSTPYYTRFTYHPNRMSDPAPTNCARSSPVSTISARREAQAALVRAEDEAEEKKSAAGEEVKPEPTPRAVKSEIIGV